MVFKRNLWYNINSLGVIIMLENKLGITNAVELAKEEEKITKIKALELFDSNKINPEEFWILSSGALVLRGIYEDS